MRTALHFSRWIWLHRMERRQRRILERARAAVLRARTEELRRLLVQAHELGLA